MTESNCCTPNAATAADCCPPGCCAPTAKIAGPESRRGATPVVLAGALAVVTLPVAILTEAASCCGGLCPAC